MIYMVNFWDNPKVQLKLIKWSLLIGVSFWLLWSNWIQRFIYQRLYGQPDPVKWELVELDTMADIPEQPEQDVTIRGIPVRFQLVKSFSTTAKIVAIDRYNWLGTFYRSRKGAKLYDTIVPLDISLATGRTARKLKCFKFSHDYRVLETELKCNFYDDKEISNNHTIPINSRVRRGLEVLKVGDLAHIEGYLVYWQGLREYSYYRFESAITLDQVSKDLYGGHRAGLCRQLLITKISFGGYVFE